MAGWLSAIASFVVFAGTAISGSGPNPGAVDDVGTVIFGLVMAAGFLRSTLNGAKRAIHRPEWMA